MTAFPVPPTLLRPTFDAVVWDFDGTLAASRFADEAAVAELIAREAANAAGAEVFWAMEGKPILERLELAWPGRGLEILPLFEQRVAPQRYRGVLPVLQGLQRSRRPQAVVSSRRRDFLEWGIEVTGLRPYFATVVGLEDVTEAKPSPEGLLTALRALGTPPSRAVYIGDSDLDMEAARRAGTTGWRATWGRLPNPDAGPAALLLRNPRDVLSRLSEPPAAG